METILSSPSLSPLFNTKPPSFKTLLPPSLQPNTKPLLITSSLKNHSIQSPKTSPPTPTNWVSFAQQGLAALALSLALNFCPILPDGNALASEFDVLNEGPPKESYVVDDAGVLSRVTKADIKNLMQELEYKKNFRINFITVRKLTTKFWKNGTLLLKRATIRALLCLSPAKKKVRSQVVLHLFKLLEKVSLMQLYPKTFLSWQQKRSTMKPFSAVPNG